MIDVLMRYTNFPESTASIGQAAMGFAPEKQLEELFRRLEAEYGHEALKDLYLCRGYIQQQNEKHITNTCIRELLLSLSVYTLQILADLQAPLNVLMAGFFLDPYLRSNTPREFDNLLPHGKQINPLLKNAAQLYKYEMPLPWRQSPSGGTFEESVLQYLRLRARSNIELSSQSILRAKAQHENHRRLIVATAQEPDVLLIKLVDRIALLKFLKPGSEFMKLVNIHDEAFLQDLATETLNIHVLIAERLGIWKLKWPLQDLAFRIQSPEEYQEITREISTKRHARETILREIIEAIETGLKELGIVAEVNGRPKSIYSIYQKKTTQNVETRKINDLIGVRVVVDSNTIETNQPKLHNTGKTITAEMKKAERKAIRDVKREAEREGAKGCYAVLDYLLRRWPAPMVDGKGIYDDGKVSRDWITHPKPNGYQSIHTSIVYKPGEANSSQKENVREQIVEVQIRTKEMHQVAEYGIAAHWIYKEKARFLPHISKKEKMWNFEQIKHNGENGNLQNEVGSFSENKIFCLTPKGEVLHFPSGATPIDFAYRIHNEIGNRLLNAKVNNKVVSFSHELKNGDIVEIVTSKGERGPKGEWLRQDKKFARSSKTKSMIRQWLRKHKLMT